MFKCVWAVFALGPGGRFGWFSAGDPVGAFGWFWITEVRSLSAYDLSFFVSGPPVFLGGFRFGLLGGGGAFRLRSR